MSKPGTPARQKRPNFDYKSMLWRRGQRFAVRFYGTGTGQIDRIKIPLSSAPLLNVGSNFTIEFWMRANYADNTGTVSSGQNGDGWITGNIIVDRDIYGPGDYGDFGIAIGRTGRRNVLAFGAHNGDGDETIVGTQHVGNGVWHHVAVTRTASNGLMRIYVDGVLDAEGVGPTGNVSYRIGRATSWPNSDPFLVLGAEKHDAGSEYPSFRGYFDELRIWSRVLSSSELAVIGNQIIPPEMATGLVAWFRMEEGTNQLLRDSVHGCTATLFSATSGNGEWTSWAVGSNAAPIQAYQPYLSIRTESAQSAWIRWFAPQNIRYDLEQTESLWPNPAWSPVLNATNLTATDTNMEIFLNVESPDKPFLRTRGSPFR